MIEDFAGYVSRMFRVQREHSSRLPERPPVEEDDLLPSTSAAAGMADAETAWPVSASADGDDMWDFLIATGIADPNDQTQWTELPRTCVEPGCTSEPIRVRPGYEDRCLVHVLPIGLGDARPTMPWGAA